MSIETKLTAVGDGTFRVELVSVTPNAEALILYCARVSSNQDNTDPGLLKYLIRNNHWSPFELAHMVVEINTSRAIAQQILRHRSFSFQEFSQRYAVAQETVFYDARQSGSSNRQSSLEPLNEGDQQWWRKTQEDVAEYCFKAYHQALDLGIAKECARFVLPLSTKTKLYMSGSLRSWIHYFKLRCDPHTQKEHMDIALAIEEIFNMQFPIIAEALTDER